MGKGSGIPSLPYPSIAQLPIRLKGNSNINALLGLRGGGGVVGGLGGGRTKTLILSSLQKGPSVLLMVFTR